MRSTPALDARAGLEKLATYPFQIATWVDESGYPVSVAIEASIDRPAFQRPLRRRRVCRCRPTATSR